MPMAQVLPARGDGPVLLSRWSRLREQSFVVVRVGGPEPDRCTARFLCAPRSSNAPSTASVGEVPEYLRQAELASAAQYLEGSVVVFAPELQDVDTIVAKHPAWRACTVPQTAPGTGA